MTLTKEDVHDAIEDAITQMMDVIEQRLDNAKPDADAIRDEVEDAVAETARNAARAEARKLLQGRNHTTKPVAGDLAKLIEEDNRVQTALSRVFSHLTRTYRSTLVQDFGMRLLEGRLRVIEKDGNIEARINEHDVATVLSHVYGDGARVRLLVIPEDEAEEAGRTHTRDRDTYDNIQEVKQ